MHRIARAAVVFSAVFAGAGIAGQTSPAVTGRVEAAGTGRGIANVAIHAIGENGQDHFLGRSGSDGSYSAGVAALPPGNYRFSAVPADGDAYVRQAFPGLDCVWFCTQDLGTPFAMPADAGHVDFVLDPGGRLRVRVTDSDTGEPLQYAIVAARGEGHVRAYASQTDAAGYAAFPPLIAADYVLTTRMQGGYVNEVYDDRPCTGTCDSASGDPLPVAAGAQVELAVGLTPGIGLRGHLRAPDGAPLYGYVAIFDTQGELFDIAYGNPDGTFATSGNYAPGTYHLVAFADYRVPAIYPAGNCFPCDPVADSPAVTLGTQSIDGLDFTLQPGASVTGALALPGTDWPAAKFEITTPDGTPVWPMTWIFEDRYELYGVAPGSYVVRILPLDDTFVGEQYLGVPCYVDRGCDRSLATLVQVGPAPAAVAGIDLRLRPDALFRDGHEPAPRPD